MMSTMHRLRTLLFSPSCRTRKACGPALHAHAHFSTLPTIIDPHHHFYDPSGNAFHAFLGSLGAGPYSAADYAEASREVDPVNTVHIECMPDGGAAEAAWVEKLVQRQECRVGAIVGNCKLPRMSAPIELKELVAAAPLLRGVRFILDYDGPFDGTNATHVASTSPGHGSVDYLRDPQAAPMFERGFKLLAQHSLSFDLQCCPAQLPAAAALCRRYPEIPVVIDHLGKPRHLLADGGESDQAKLEEWRKGMEMMADLNHVCVKISMLGYAVPGWTEDPAKEALVRDLVQETIGLFGANRCMFASNWHGSGAMSNSDGADSCDISMPELYQRYFNMVEHLPTSDVELLFSGTARRFYRLSH